LAIGCAGRLVFQTLTVPVLLAVATMRGSAGLKVEV
jgi:hypothetical protein